MASPVTLDEAKAHLRVTHIQDDTLIGDYLEAATAYVETISERTFSSRLVTKTQAAFPMSVIPLRLPASPVEFIESIDYTDPDGASQSMDLADVYLVEDAVQKSCIFLEQDKAWPATQHRADAVTVTYSAGYGGDANVPDTAKHAILFLLGHFYEQRMAVIVGTSQTELSYAVEALVSTLRPGTYANPDLVT